MIIPAGTKGAIRGLKFNKAVKERIQNMHLDCKRFKVEYEKNIPDKKISCDQIPDCYIYDSLTKKYLIIMNQIDLWSGGQQSNRGSYYINQPVHTQYKMICVVCNHIQFTKETKAFILFKTGFKNNTLCYIKKLPFLIREYFR